MSNVILGLQGIWAGYDASIDILKGVSFEIRQGEITSIIGANGAGKSTVFKVIFGFLKPKKGDVYFNQERITNLGPVQRLAEGISYCPQGRCNFPLLTVEENLRMGAYSRRDATVKSDVESMLERFPVLREKRNSLAGNLSGGEQQILEMAMALLLKPRLLLLDEPSLGLAPIMMDLVFSEVKRIREDGTTLVLIEQNAKRSLQISDHAIVIRLGQVAMEGTGQEILNDDRVKKMYLGG